MKYLYLVLLSIFFTNCVSVPKEFVANDTLCNYNAPIFNIIKEELTLNQNILNQLKNKEGSLVVVDNEFFKSEFYNLSSEKIINYKTDKRLNIGKWLVYRKNGIIKFSEFRYIIGTKPIFKETHYDEQGNITKVIDYEKGYKICWSEAIEIVKKIAKKEIKKYEITGFYAVHNNLNKGSATKKPLWFIGLYKGNEAYEDEKNKNGTIRFRIDGITGKVLKKYRIESSY